MADCRVSDAAAPLVKIGEPFNPHLAFLGVFVPLGLLPFPGLSVHAKLLYGRLMMYAGRDGLCNPALETLSKQFNVSIDTISRSGLAS